MTRKFALSRPLPEGGGRHAVLPLKGTVEIGRVLKSVVQGDLHDGVVRLLQLKGRPGQPVFDEIFDAGGADGGLKYIHKVYLLMVKLILFQLMVIKLLLLFLV